MNTISDTSNDRASFHYYLLDVEHEFVVVDPGRVDEVVQLDRPLHVPGAAAAARAHHVDVPAK